MISKPGPRFFGEDILPSTNFYLENRKALPTLYMPGCLEKSSVRDVEGDDEILLLLNTGPQGVHAGNPSL